MRLTPTMRRQLDDIQAVTSMDSTNILRAALSAFYVQLFGVEAARALLASAAQMTQDDAATAQSPLLDAASGQATDTASVEATADASVETADEEAAATARRIEDGDTAPAPVKRRGSRKKS